MNKNAVVCAMSILTAVTCAFAQKIEVSAAATVPKEYTGKSGEKFLYRWHEPAVKEQQKKYPLVILLHGAGERGDNNKSQLQWGGTPIVEYFKKTGEEFFFVAGQVPRGLRWVEVPWNEMEHRMPEQPSKSMGLLIELISSLLSSELPIDHDRLYATGVSMGGYGTWDLISRKPEWFAAAMPVCGGGDVKQAAKLRDLPISIHHGDADGSVPLWRSRAMISALYAAGSFYARYTEYPGCGHNSWIPAYGTEANLKWMFSKKRHVAKSVAADIFAEAGVPWPGAHYEMSFEFSQDGGKTWHRGSIRQCEGFPQKLINDAVVSTAPFKMKSIGVKKLRIVGNKVDGIRFRNGSVKLLP
jgi:poly(3-hydroxybutyrate) depolymerase